MRDIRKRPAVHQRRRANQGLHQVRVDRVAQQGSNRTCALQITRRHGLAVVGLTHHDASDALLQILQVGGQAQDRHDLAGCRDVEPALARSALARPAQPRDDVAQ